MDGSHADEMESKNYVNEHFFRIKNVLLDHLTGYSIVDRPF